VRMFQPHGFQRIHREYAVNLRWVREVRRRRRGRDWEVKMEPPVHRVLPVSRSEWPKLEAALKRLGSQRRRGR
jgi:DNA-binding LytR/AlgR family response regulator